MIKYKETKVIEVSDWDKLVEETYGRPYSFQQQDDCKPRGVHNLSVPEGEYDYENDTIPEIINGYDQGVSFKSWLSRDPQQKLNEDDPDYHLRLFWERNFYPNVSMIANDLHSKGLLPGGDYLINIDW